MTVKEIAVDSENAEKFRRLADQREERVEKIALFAGQNGEVTHAARQQANGIWTSKLGDGKDIDHKAVEGVGGAGIAYVAAVQFLQRPRAVKETTS